MVAKQKHKANKEHNRQKEKEKDMKFGTSISQFTLEKNNNKKKISTGQVIRTNKSWTFFVASEDTI